MPSRPPLSRYRRLVKQWHPTKNGSLRPADVTAGSDRRIWWRCDKGHEWEAIARHRADGRGCPYCAGQRATPQTSLAGVHPELAKQWHKTLNGSLRPDGVMPFSHRKVWWKCPKGHRYETAISSRSVGYGCPICAGRQVSKATSLAARHPKLARQWHPTRNGRRTAQDVTPGSSRRVWWQCTAGHEWQAVVGSRAKRGTGCPVCAGRVADAETSLSALHPEIARQWHPTRNKASRPADVRPGSHVKVWWQCAKGHSYEASVGNRTTLGRGCPFCSGRRVWPAESLRRRKPSVARQWHPSRNGRLSPADVRPTAQRTVWRRCERGHNWQAKVSTRVKGAGCPKCASGKSSLAALRPALTRQWDRKQNGALRPQDVSLGSGRVVGWRCGKGHRWQASVVHRVRGSGCPYCSGRRPTAETCLQATHPKLARQWVRDRNGELSPRDVSAGSGKKVWWQCPATDGHQWQAPVYNRATLGHGCPLCRKDKRRRRQRRKGRAVRVPIVVQ